MPRALYVTTARYAALHASAIDPLKATHVAKVPQPNFRNKCRKPLLVGERVIVLGPGLADVCRLARTIKAICRNGIKEMQDGYPDMLMLLAVAVAVQLNRPP